MADKVRTWLWMDKRKIGAQTYTIKFPSTPGHVFPEGLGLMFNLFDAHPHYVTDGYDAD